MISGAFNLRVYGIALKNRQVLISSELGGNHAFTKFPGGGLEPGEGLADCLIREMREELQTDVSVGTLFYVNDFYQPSAFNPAQQIISFYYFMELNPELMAHRAIEKRWNKEYIVEFRWENLEDLQPEDLSFPIDKQVLEKLKEGYLSK